MTSTPSTKVLTKNILQAAKELEAALLKATRQATDGDDASGLYGVAEGAVEQALARVRKDLQQREDVYPLSRFDDVPAQRMRELRAKSSWSQSDLALQMNRYGFEWDRFSVANVEGGKRRLSLTEIAQLSAIFEVPMVEMLLVEDRSIFVGSDEEWVHVPDEVQLEYALSPDRARAFVIGANGKVGTAVRNALKANN